MTIAQRTDQMTRRVDRYLARSIAPNYLELQTVVGGYNYGVRFDQTGLILETACESRWTWGPSATGDLWLDEQLQKAVNSRLAEMGS